MQSPKWGFAIVFLLSAWMTKAKAQTHLLYPSYIHVDHTLHNTGAPLKVSTLKARGLVPAVFTPLNHDLTINYSIIPIYAKYLAHNGIKAVLVTGTGGEGMTFSVDDKKRLVHEWMKASKTTGLHIMVQVGAVPLPDVLELARYCEHVGVDSLLTLPEMFFKPTSVSDLVFFMHQISKVAPSLPLLYYHHPAATNVLVNMADFVKAANENIPNFKGIKFDSWNLTEANQVVKLLKDDQEIFIANCQRLAPAKLLGIKSSIAGATNLFPQLAMAILDAVDKGDVHKARVLQEKMNLAIEAVEKDVGHVRGLKTGMGILTGIDMGQPNLPNRPVSDAARHRIERRLNGLGFHTYETYDEQRPYKGNL